MTLSDVRAMYAVAIGLAVFAIKVPDVRLWILILFSWPTRPPSKAVSMLAASMTLTILLAFALGVLWRRSSAVGVDHADRLSTLEQNSRNAQASIGNLTACVEELQERQFEHGLDHVPARKPPRVKVGPAVVPVKKAARKRPAVKKAAPVKAPATRAAAKRSVR